MSDHRRFSTTLLPLLILACGGVSVVFAQESPDGGDASSDSVLERTTEKASEIGEKTREQVKDIAEKVDADEQANQAKESVLEPIYALAERLSFPAFHWVAFAAMTAGVVSFALQLVLGKLIVLTQRGFSLMEILGDGLGLFISVVGLVLTTQAATENSTFTSSAFSVLSAAGVGALVGLVFYLSGQRQELDAVQGRIAEKSSGNDRRS